MNPIIHELDDPDATVADLYYRMIEDNLFTTKEPKNIPSHSIYKSNPDNSPRSRPVKLVCGDEEVICDSILQAGFFLGKDSTNIINAIKNYDKNPLNGKIKHRTNKKVYRVIPINN